MVVRQHSASQHNTTHKMKKTSLVALVIIATQFAGCSQESKTNTPTATTATNSGTVVANQKQDTKAKAEEYKETDLPFQAALAVNKGGGFQDKVGEGGVVKTTADGVTIASLSLGDKDIPLESTNVTADAEILTKDYGKLRVKMNYATFTCTMLVTPTQEAALRKLLK